MSNPMPSPSVPDADAVDLTSPEGAAVPAGDAGDALAQGMGGAPPAEELGDAPVGAAPSSVDAEDLAPALDAAGIEHDMGSPAKGTNSEATNGEGATGAPTGSEAGREDEAQPQTGEAARSGNVVDISLGVVRLGVGVALVAAPRWAGRLWVGPGADGPGSLVFARALGARDVALGIRILDGVRKGEPVGHWVTAGFAADAADVAATLVAGRHLTPARRVAMPLIAGAVAALGVVSARRS